MKRTPLTNGSGRWFDEDKAEVITEDTYHDGRNFISKATGSQWEHERLWRTAGGRWILNHWSNWQGSSESYEEVSDLFVAEWLAKQGLDSHETVEELYNELEIK